MAAKSSKSLRLKRLAEKEYKKALKRIEKMVGDTTTYSDTLLTTGKKLFGSNFVGVYSADKVPNKMKKKQMYIVNLDKSGLPGSHWVAIGKGKHLLAYDSFGRCVYSILPTMKHKKIENTERDVEQSDEEQNCGARCLAFCIVFDKYGFDVAKYI